MKIRIVFSIFILLVTSTSQAGQETGNGGDAVVCYAGGRSDGRILSASLVDYEELVMIGQPPIPSLGKNRHILERVREILSPIGKVSPALLAIFNEEATFLVQEIENMLQGRPHSPRIVFSTGNLPDIPDAGNLIVKQGCFIKQLAIRLRDPAEKLLYNGADFVFQKDILHNLEPNHIAGIVTHEVLFGHAVSDLGEANSILTRVFNRNLALRSDYGFFETVNLMKNAAYRTVQGAQYSFDVQTEEWRPMNPDGSRVIWGDLLKFLDPSLISYPGLSAYQFMLVAIDANGEVDRAQSMALPENRDVRLRTHTFDLIPNARPCAIRRAVLDAAGNFDLQATLAHPKNQPHRVGFKFDRFAKLNDELVNKNYSNIKYSKYIQSVDVVMDGITESERRENVSRLANFIQGKMSENLPDSRSAFWVDVPIYGTSSVVSIVIQGKKRGYVLEKTASSMIRQGNPEVFGEAKDFNVLEVLRSRCLEDFEFWKDFTRYNRNAALGNRGWDEELLIPQDTRFELKVDICEEWSHWDVESVLGRG